LLSFNEFPVPTQNSDLIDITAGPDGNLWFTEALANRIGQITPDGTIIEFTIPTANSFPSSITAGPDGNVWFMSSRSRMIAASVLAMKYEIRFQSGMEPRVGGGAPGPTHRQPSAVHRRFHPLGLAGMDPIPGFTGHGLRLTPEFAHRQGTGNPPFRPKPRH
jgi:hypothetical protein